MAVVLISYSYEHERGRLVRDSIATARALTSAMDRDLAGVQSALYALATSPHLASGDLRAFHSQAKEVLPNVEFKHDPLDQALRAAAQELGIKAAQMFQPIRVAVCGRKNAPPLFETLEVLGKQTTLRRISLASQRLP